MKSINKKVVLYITIICIGILDIALILLHDYMQEKLTYYGFYDKVGILIGVILFVIGLILFILEKCRIYEKKNFFSKKINLYEALLGTILVASLFGLGILSHNHYTREKIRYTWSIGIYTSSSYEPFNFTDEKNVSNPVLTADDIFDVRAEAVADPFLIYEDNVYYMFFEVLNTKTYQGDIGLATSRNGLDWTYNKIVLDESFHLSYPCVFKWKNEYYMIPETHKKESVRLYKANDFPYNWSLVKTLLKERDFSDNTIFHYNNIWWLFTETGDNDILSLYYADTPLGPWTEHPKSPIINGDANIARPGGNVIIFDNRIIRFTQDDDPYYGNQVWAFEITTLTKKEYKEQMIGNTPVLKGYKEWNIQGMHHISLYHTSDNKWIASVDGY